MMSGTTFRSLTDLDATHYIEAGHLYFRPSPDWTSIAIILKDAT